MRLFFHFPLYKQRIMAKEEKLRVNHRRNVFIFFILYRWHPGKRERWQMNLLAHHSFFRKKLVHFVTVKVDAFVCMQSHCKAIGRRNAFKIEQQYIKKPA